MKLVCMLRYVLLALSYQGIGASVLCRLTFQSPRFLEDTTRTTSRLSIEKDNVIISYRNLHINIYLDSTTCDPLHEKRGYSVGRHSTLSPRVQIKKVANLRGDSSR